MLKTLLVLAGLLILIVVMYFAVNLWRLCTFRIGKTLYIDVVDADAEYLEEARKKEEEERKKAEEEAKEKAGSGQAVVDYACQFIGNPYVWGGTSLTNGADCSGFVQSVYKHFGVNLPRTSGQ